METLKNKFINYKIALLLFCLVSLNGFGQSSWQRAYGTSYKDFARQMIHLSNGDYLLSGENYVQSNGIYTTGYIVKTKPNGDTIWTKRFFPTDSGTGVIIPTIYEINPNDYLLSEGTILIGLDSNGNIMWSKGKYNANIFSILDYTATNKIIFCNNLKIGSVDTSGVFNWVINFPHNINPRLVIKTIGGKYCYLYKDSINRVYFKEVSAFGQILRDTLLPFLSIHAVTGLLFQDKDGNFISVNDDQAINVIKFNNSLEILWQKSHPVSATHYSDAITQTSDNYYVIVGEYLNDPAGDISFLKIDTSGNKIFFKSLARFGKQEKAVDAYGDNDGGIVFFGRGEDGQFGDFDLLLAKINSDGTLGIPFLSYGKELQLTLYPNPAQDYLQIKSKENLNGKIQVYQLDGICVFENEISNKDISEVDVQNLSSGIYLVKVTDDMTGSFYCQKFIKK